MPHTIYLVLCDLLQFVRNGFRDEQTLTVVKPATMAVLPSSPQLQSLAARPQAIQIEPTFSKSLLASPIEGVTEKDKTIVFAGTARLLEPQLMYVTVPEGTPLFVSALQSFDGALSVLTYGQAVSVVSYHEGYAHVTTQGRLGFVRKDDITPHKIEVWPHLGTGVRYEADSISARQVRLLIGDAFGAGRLLLPLQAGEYILFRLLLDQHAIVWPEVRPREPGRWHEILRGQQYIRSAVTPATDSIMEWTGDDGIGRLGYVEAVLPDLTICLTGVGFAEAGEYTEALIPSDVWREWRPVFITVQA